MIEKPMLRVKVLRLGGMWWEETGVPKGRECWGKVLISVIGEVNWMK